MKRTLLSILCLLLCATALAQTGPSALFSGTADAPAFSHYSAPVTIDKVLTAESSESTGGYMIERDDGTAEQALYFNDGSEWLGCTGERRLFFKNGVLARAGFAIQCALYEIHAGLTVLYGELVMTVFPEAWSSTA